MNVVFSAVVLFFSSAQSLFFLAIKHGQVNFPRLSVLHYPKHAYTGENNVDVAEAKICPIRLTILLVGDICLWIFENRISSWEQMKPSLNKWLRGFWGALDTFLD